MLNFFKDIIDGALKLISSIGFFDIVDIIFVAVALYYVVKLLRQTRAYNLVKGIILMGLIYLVVSTLDMNTSSYIFGQFFGNILVVMLILFQPEIRHAVESFGRRNFNIISLFSSKNNDIFTEETENITANISKAVSNMSDKKIGALIVVEGKTLLGDVTDTGNSIDSVISSVMLENIFFPKSPLHDGAVVIRDGRIHSAGCILPLTQAEVSAELGTRHRAAIGISENSDALVVVVSEETGAVSVAAGGALERSITIGELHETLSTYLRRDASDNEKNFRILRRRR